MLPNQLTMSAFGPYSQEVTINFEEFIQEGLFLITGPTGTGKTMIFDAIMFALYGVSSGSMRSSDQFRSDLANDTTPTFVELEFTLSNQRYKLRRSPKYTLPNKKTPKMPTALLTMPNKTIVEGVKEVNAKIKEVLGIDEKQFRQIAMIAQGEFTKLIYASSDEREKVLHNLFQSDIYGYVEEQLKLQVKEYKDKYDLLFAKRHMQYSNLGINEDIDLNEFYDNKKEVVKLLEKDYSNKDKQLKDNQKQLDIIEINNKRLNHLNDLQTKLKYYQDNEDKYKALNDEIKELKKAKELLPKYQIMIKNQNKLQLLIKNNQVIKEKIKLANDSLSKQSLEYNKLTDYNKSINEYKIAINKLKELKEKYKTFQQDLFLKEQLNKQIKVVVSKNIGIEDKITKGNKIYEKDNESVSKLDKLKSDYDLFNSKYQKLHQYKVEIHELATKYDKYLASEDNCYELQEQYQKIENTYMKEKETYDLMEHKYRLGQAGILASTLKDNEPCPVCGSIHHPNIAILNDDIVYENDLKKAKLNFDKRTDKRNNIYNNLLLKKQEVVLLKEQMELDCKRLEIDDELEKEIFIKVLNKVNNEEEALLKQTKGLDEEIIYLKKLTTSLVNQRNDLDKLDNLLQDNLKKIQELNDKLNQVIGRIEQNDYLNEYNGDKIDNDIKEKENKLVYLEKLIKDIELKYYSFKEEVVKLDSQCNTLNKQIIQEENEYEDSKSNYLLSFNELFSDEKKFIELSKDINSIVSKEEVYQKYLITYSSLESQVKQLKEELINVQFRDASDLKLEISKYLNDISIIQKQLSNEKAVLLTIEKAISSIKQIDNDLKESHDIYQRYLDLSEMASGKNNYRISFERYVLAAYFENILVYANVLLKRMSQGRYLLYRRDNRSKGAGKQGLELDVLDLESGVLRDVKTLSGGESFKAALSLALGLSKMIQSYAGGIELNTLFIDEGFGSLDSQSLDNAIDCLIDLQQDGKLIGIISHVSELKQRIDHQIILSRSNKETKIAIE